MVSSAGATDMSSKPADVGFSMMRNVINRDKDGNVTGSDVSDYLERAEDLNSEVESVGYVIETDAGDMIKVYVNAEQASEFEEEMSKLLGLDGDPEAAINTLAQKFDIIDVVWPKSPEDEETDAEDPYASADIDDVSSFMEPNDQDTESTIDDSESALPADDEEPESGAGSLMKSVSADTEKEPEADDAESTEGDDTDDESTGGGAAGDDTDADTDTDADSSDDETADETPTDDGEATDDTGDDVDSEGGTTDSADTEEEPELDDDGNPKPKKKKKPAEEGSIKTEEGLKRRGRVLEGAREEISAHVAAEQARGHKGKYVINCRISGDMKGLRDSLYKRAGAVQYFESRETAAEQARQLSIRMNKAGAKAHFSYTPKLVEEDTMADTIGSSFLARVNEAKADTDGVRDGFNISLDTQLRGLAARLKLPLAKQIVALFAMTGIPGRYINNIDGIEDGIMGAADMLRRKSAVRRSFTAFYNALASSKGLKIQEAKKRGGYLQKMLEGVLVALGLPGEVVVAGGPGAVNTFLYRISRDIDTNSELEKSLRQLAVRLGVKAEDEIEPVAESIIGSTFKDRVLGEDVDVSNDEFMMMVAALVQALGIPEKNLQYQRSTMVRNMRLLKQKLSNRGMIQQRMGQLLALLQKNTKQDQTVQQDAVAQPVTEAEISNDLAVKKIFDKVKGTPNLKVSTLKPLVAKYLTMVGKEKTDLEYLTAGVWTKLEDAGLVEGQLNESFAPLEALVKADLEHYNMIEPNAGPAMLATYEGGGVHEETILGLGVDPDADDPNKNLCVGVDGPFDGRLHCKYFTNTKDGYKAALEYANILRTVNLRSGGKPKGWK
jgi:hypothetical protein